MAAVQSAESPSLELSDFVQRLHAYPSTREIVREHIEDHDGVLAHLLVADLLRHAQALLAGGDRGELDWLIALMDQALLQGDPALNNAVALSFVEDSQWWDPEQAAFVSSWPPGLQSELQRQRDWVARIQYGE